VGKRCHFAHGDHELRKREEVSVEYEYFDPKLSQKF